MRTSPLVLPLLAVLAGCATTDATNDVAAVRADALRRTDTATTAADDVAALLAQPLDEQAAVRVLLLSNHRVGATFERLGIGRADLVQAGLLRNPVFDVDCRFVLDGGTELELGLAQPFVDLFWRPLRERLAEHEFAAARLLATDALVHAVFAVRGAFVDLRTARATADLHRAAVRTAASAHQLALELHSAGNVTDQVLAVERARETRARLDLAAAELAELEARETVNALLGLWGPDTTWTLAGEGDDDMLAAPDTRNVESRAVAASLDLAAARAGVDALAQRAGLASWRGWLPDAEFGISAIRETDGDQGFGPRFRVELPLFDAGGASRARAETALRAALHDHAAIAVDVRSAARRLRTRFLRLAAHERFLREVHLPQRAEVLRTTVQNYNAMQVGAFDVLHQRRQQLADELEHMAVRRSLQHARLDLQQLLAGALPQAASAAAAAPRKPTIVPDLPPEH